MDVLQDFDFDSFLHPKNDQSAAPPPLPPLRNPEETYAPSFSYAQFNSPWDTVRTTGVPFISYISIFQEFAVMFLE